MDVEGGFIYWTDMGHPPDNDGAIERADLDGSNRKSIVPPGGTHTPKQMQLEPVRRTLYWSDREGMRVMRCGLDGSNVETLVQTGQGDADSKDETRSFCVGIAVDYAGGHIYWTQKGTTQRGKGSDPSCSGSIFLPVRPQQGRSDIEVIYDGLPGADRPRARSHRARPLYWTDRGDPPRGNTVNRAPLDAAQRAPAAAGDPRDAPRGRASASRWTRRGGRLFVTDMGRDVWATADLDGSHRRPIMGVQGNLTGIAYAELSSSNGGPR